MGTLRHEPEHRDTADALEVLILDGPRAGRRINVSADLLVGRGESAQLDVEDDEVSRRHARFRRLGDRLEVTDLGSLNGTWVNGARITDPIVLAPGDVVKLGTTRLEVVGPVAPSAPTG